ncbi:hypothetical protein ScPMuIL_006706 [Solemya velum]
MFVERRPGDKVRLRSPQDWILPRKLVLGICLFGVVFTLIGVILLAVGGGALPWGSVMFGLGLCCLITCALLAIHAFCFVYSRTGETQTSEKDFFPGGGHEVIPTYAVIDKKSLQPATVIGQPVAVVPAQDGQTSGGYAPRGASTLPHADRTGHDKSAPTGGPQGTYQPRPPAYGMHSSHPTAYSTLPGTQTTGQPPMHSYKNPYQTQPAYQQSPPHINREQPHGQPPVPQHGFRNPREEYDNTGESAPMLNAYQPQAEQPPWRPAHAGIDQEPPEPQRLRYPSEKRPMTFEQTSSSKMSVYDNVQFAFADNEI